LWDHFEILGVHQKVVKEMQKIFMKYIACCRISTDEFNRQILSIEAKIAEVKEWPQ